MIYRCQLVAEHHQNLIDFYQTQIFFALLYFPNNGKRHPCPISKFLLRKIGFISLSLYKRS